MSRSTVYLVRHAKAGERRAWTGDDLDRPLSAAGWRQAEAIGKRLSKHGATSVVSSPYVRCVQTLQPLGKRIDADVETDDRLSEGAPYEAVLEIIAGAPSGTVLCSHGDLIPAVVEALARRGMEVQSEPDWRKGTIWVLSRSGDHVSKGKVWPPPSNGSIK